MKPNQTLDEAHKYLMYIADALWNAGSTFHMEKQDKVILEKCANDLAEYAKVIDQVKNRIQLKEQMRKDEIEEDNSRS